MAKTPKKTTSKGLRGLAGDQWETVDGQTWAQLMQGIAGTMGVGIKEAMEQAVFMLCCDILAQDISKAPLYLRKRNNRGSSTIVGAKEHRIARMLALDPNERHTWLDLWQMTTYWLAMKSNSYIYAPRLRNNEIERFVPLQEWQVDARINPGSRETFYAVTAGNEHERALLGFSQKVIPASDIIHLRHRLINGFKGTATLDIGAGTLKTSAEMDAFRGDLVANSGQLRGVFKRAETGEVSDAAFERLRIQLDEAMRAYRSKARPLVLEDGLEFQETSSKPHEMELAKQFDNIVVQVCRLTRVPPHKVFHFINVKYENMEIQEKSYIGDTLDPILRNVELCLNRFCLSEDERLDGMFFEFDRSELTIRDPKTMMEQTHKFFSTGIISRAEAKIEHGWEVKPGDDVYLIPTSSVLVDRNNKPLIEMPKPEPAAASPTTPPKKELRVVGGHDA